MRLLEGIVSVGHSLCTIMKSYIKEEISIEVEINRTSSEQKRTFLNSNLPKNYIL
jgi:hypothetical protein